MAAEQIGVGLSWGKKNRKTHRQSHLGPCVGVELEVEQLALVLARGRGCAACCPSVAQGRRTGGLGGARARGKERRDGERSQRGPPFFCWVLRRKTARGGREADGVTGSAGCSCTRCICRITRSANSYCSVAQQCGNVNMATWYVDQAPKKRVSNIL